MFPEHILVYGGGKITCSEFFIHLTNKVLHDLRIVAVKDGRGEPADVELDVSLSRFDVLLVADVHRLAPVSRQGDAHETCQCKQQL